jgi:hypothetical protein
MAAVNALGIIETRDGARVCRQASELLDKMLRHQNQLNQLNASAARLSQNEMKHCLLMLLRRDARLLGVLIPCLNT